MAEPSRAQSDDCYATISFLAEDGLRSQGTVGWREGMENRVVFTVWDGPSFSAQGTSLAAAFLAARADIIRAGFTPQAPEDGSLAELFAEPPETSHAPLSSHRIPAIWLVVITTILALLASALLNAAVPEHGKRLPFPNAPYDYRYEGPDFDTRDSSRNSAARIRHEAKARGAEDPGGLALDPVIAILDRASSEVIARYRLDGGQFCDHEDDNCDLDGIFPIVLSSMTDEPVLGVVRHVGAHGQALSILRPLKDRRSPVFEAVADHALSFRLRSDRLEIAIDHVLPTGAARLERLRWPTDPGKVSPGPAPSAITLPTPPPVSTSAAEFVAKLRLIATERDIDEFMGLLNDDVMVSCGGSGGKAEFAGHWRLDTERGRSTLWATLERLLEHGGWNEAGGKDDDGVDFPERLALPWFFQAWPGDADAENAFIVEKTAPLRAAPELAAPIVARLAHPTVVHGRVEEGDEAPAWVDHGWLAVSAPESGLGFVRQEDVVPLLGTRILAVATPGGWKIEAMVSGD